METIEKQGSGVMLGYFPKPGGWPNPLAAIGVPETEPHLTVLYFGKQEETTPEILAAARLILQQFAQDQTPLRGSLNGIARFSATTTTSGSEAIVRLADVPGLETLRETLRERLAFVGLRAKANHGYVPHNTLTFVEPGTPVPMDAPVLDFVLDNLTFAVGGQHTIYPLTGIEKRRLAQTSQSRSADGKFSINSAISKVDLDKQYVFGWASVSEVNDEVLIDHHGDIIEESEMESMAYDFVLNARVGGEMHTYAVGTLIESFAFTKEKQKAMGVDLGFSGWWVGFHIENAEAWEKIKKGEYAGFSIGGTAVREEVTEN